MKENVRLIPGWIGDTLEPFLAENEGPIDYLHVDTDTYSPAKTALSLARPRLVEGSIILFDELYGYPAWEHEEYKALTETLPEDCYEFVGFSQMSAAQSSPVVPPQMSFHDTCSTGQVGPQFLKFEGSIILFDELYGYPAWEHHEYRALTETLPEDCYEFVGFSQMSAALRIKTAPGAA